jgi:hypothetical protein
MLFPASCFVTPTPTPAAGALRPLSDADALELDEDDEGAD